MADLEFYERHFDIHGELDGKVYRTKRNGEKEVYDYQPVSHYKRTPLTIRNESIRKAVSAICTPNDPEYRSIIRKVNYYTPYILNPGSYEFLAERVFYVREKGSYEFLWEGSEMGSIYKLGKRSKVSFNFRSDASKTLSVFYKGELYCQREFMITAIEDLDAEYIDWLDAHLAEIITLPEPEFESVKIYRRGMRSKSSWLKTVAGKDGETVFLTRSDLEYKDKRQRPWVYHRKTYDHSGNAQSQEFNGKMAEIGEAWRALSKEEKDYWNNIAKTYKYKQSGFNRFTAHYVTNEGG